MLGGSTKDQISEITPVSRISTDNSATEPVTSSYPIDGYHAGCKRAGKELDSAEAQDLIFCGIGTRYFRCREATTQESCAERH